MIQNEKEIIDFLGLPSLPQKKWDGKTPFDTAIAVIHLTTGEEAYAVATFDGLVNEKPRISKVFSLTPYVDFKIVAVVPEYMNTNNIEEWDVSTESAEAARRIAREVEEMEDKNSNSAIDDVPKNEYFFDFITNDEEAQAYIRSWNRQHGIRRGRISQSHDAIVTKLAAIWMQEGKNKNNKKK